MVNTDGAKIEIEKIESYFSDERLVDFYTKYKAIAQKNNSNTRFSYLGINFKNEKVYSVKFYIHLLEDLTEEELLQFVPTADDYLRFSHLKQSSKTIEAGNAGIALEIKFKVGEKEPNFGFFFHLKNKDDIPFAQNLPAEMKDDCIAVGINFEYGAKPVFKQYYYFNKSTNKLFFGNKFGRTLIDDVNLMEYAEGGVFTKINTYVYDTVNVEKMEAFTEKEKIIIHFFNKKYNLSNFGYGVYDHQQIKSIYFFSAESYDKSIAEDFNVVNVIEKIIYAQP